MARIRYIKPELFSDTRLAEVSPLTRLFYIGLFCHLDRNGVAEDDSKLLKRNIFPYDDSITQRKIDSFIDELTKIGRLIRLTYEGRKYLYCPSFSKHQNFHAGENPKYPIPKEILLASCQHPASTLLTSFNEPTSTTGTGTGTGIGTLTGTGTPECSSEPLEGAFVNFPDVQKILKQREVSPPVLSRLLAAFPDPAWIRGEILKAVAWEAANPGRRKKNFAAFLTRWLTKGWDQRKLAPLGGPPRRGIEEILAEEKAG